jgi:hypothetical protein
VKKHSSQIVVLSLAVLIVILSGYYLYNFSCFRIFSNKSINKTLTLDKTKEPLEVVQLDLAPCRGQDGKFDNTFWAIARIRNIDSNTAFVVSNLSIALLNSSGQTIGFLPVERASVPPGSTIMVTDYHLLNERRVTAILGSVDTALIAYSDYGNIYAQEIDESLNNANWEVSLIEHIVNDDDYPKHSSKIKIKNIGSETLFRLKILASIYDLNSQLLDIGWSEEPGKWQRGVTIESGNEREIFVPSLSMSGRCLGPKNENGYKIVVQSEAFSSSGLPLNKIETFFVSE